MMQSSYNITTEANYLMSHSIQVCWWSSVNW